MKGRSRTSKMPTLALALALAALLVACADPEERVRDHLARAEQYVEEEKLSEAILEYRNVLQIDPNRADAHYGLARAYLADKQVQKAYWELQETVRLDEENLDARLQYAQFLLFGKEEDLARAVALADDVIEAEDDRAAAWLLKGRALESLERYDEARLAYEGAAERAGEEGGPILVLANFHRARGDKARAETLYRRLVEVSEGYRPRAALAGFLASAGERDDEAEAAYRAALAAAEPAEQAPAHAALANFFWARDRRDEAKQVLAEGIEAATEKRTDLIYLLARLHHVDGATEEADALIQEVTQTKPGDPEPWLVLSSYRGRLGDLDGALAAAESAIEADPEDVRAKLRRAELLVDIGHRRKESTPLAAAQAIVAGVLATHPTSAEAHFVRAKTLLVKGDAKSAEADLRRAVDARPDWAQAHMLLGSTLFLQRDLLGARASLVRSLELEADLVEAQKVLVQVHAALGDNDLAGEAARRALRSGEDPQLRVQLAQALVRQRRLEEGLAVLDAIPDEERDAEAWYATGRIHALLRDSEETRVAFENALAQAPYRREVLRGLLQLDVREGRVDESLERVRAALRESPDDPQLTRLHGEAALFAGDAATAEASFQRALELDPNNVRSIESLARYLLVTGRQEEVLATYQEAIQRNPGSATLHLMLASLHEARSEFDLAIAGYEEAVRLDANLAAAKNNLAYLLADTGGDLDRALGLAQDAKEQLPESPNAADTLGWVLYKKAELGPAIFHLRDAVERMPLEDPQRGVVQQHLAMAYVANGDSASAREVIEDALDDLERRRGSEPIPSEAEPSWASELRAMAKRLPAD